MIDRLQHPPRYRNNASIAARRVPQQVTATVAAGPHATRCAALSECSAPGAVAGLAKGRGFGRPDPARDSLFEGLMDILLNVVSRMALHRRKVVPGLLSNGIARADGLKLLALWLCTCCPDLVHNFRHLGAISSLVSSLFVPALSCCSLSCFPRPFF